MFLGGPTVRYQRFFWRHLPVMLAGILAGYIVGCNKPAVRQLFSLNALSTNEIQFQQPPPTSLTTESLTPAAISLEEPESSTRMRAAIVGLVRNSDLFGLRMAMRQIEDRFNRRYNYPYIFVNDVPFTDEFKKGIRDMTKAKVQFGTLDHESWKVPEWINATRYEQVKRDARYPHGEKDSYRKMCRFQSGYLHRHPLLRDIDYYWRIEPDVEYYCDIEYDPFAFMDNNGFKYGWNIAMTEFMDTIPTLWNTTVEFVNSHPEMLATNSLWEWLVDANGNYNGCHFWSNFEIVDLSFYRSTQYQAYFDYLDRSGGFFYERWGDAPVHSIAAALFLNATQIYYFDDIGYFHPSVVSCPANSRFSGKCVCDESKSFVQNGYCIVRFKAIKQRLLNPNSTESVHDGPIHYGQPAIKAVYE
ncbi:hypothetical protein H4R20_001233 [Coemansia guatemalensis]|uniref:Uncharacterized protein n=1 Tax=Coemansia guatemalensis TaxID=2761395 RepID=A0A9W8HZS6_9FUNG|nr:hypothetical protein H4R20_001233 [Coemansia guatemalensis]